MNKSIKEIIDQISCISMINESMNHIFDELQDNIYFRLNYFKDERKLEIKKKLTEKYFDRVFLTQSFKNTVIPQRFFCLEPDFFKTLDNFQIKLESLSGALVIVNNNDVNVGGNIDIFTQFVLQAETTLFAVWDWDNHHWLSLSCQLAAVSDLYFPSHSENLFQLSKFNPSATHVVQAGTIQWKNEYLQNNKEYILNINRTNGLLGKHIPYENFKLRNSIVTKVSETFADVGFVSPQFHLLSTEDRLTQWATFKAHLIVPVLNDVPIRFFDALCTGGIPVVPESLKGFFTNYGLHANDVFYYSSYDIMHIEELISQVFVQFDKDGQTGIERRFLMGTSQNHIDNRISKIIEICKNKYL